MSYLILLFILLIILFFVYNKFDKDILSPSFITCCMFSFCVILAFIGTFSWNYVENISFQTISIIIIGILCFVFGEYLARKNAKANNKLDDIKIVPIKIENWKLLVTIIGIIITAICYILEIKRICASYGFFSSNISELLAFYRTKTALFSTDLINSNNDIHFIVRQMKKICDVVCIIFMYIVANNIVSKDKWKNILKYSVPIIMTLLITLLSTGRSTMMHMFVGFVMMFLLLFRYKNKHFTKKNIMYIGLVLIGTLLLFYLIGPLLGRNINVNIHEYISFYLGTPVPSLDLFLKNMPIHLPYIGNETFSGIYTFLAKINLTDFVQIGSHEWINFGVFSSNVYTSFRRYYFDFGILGVVICQFIFGFIISKVYLKVKTFKYRSLLVLYGYFSFFLVDQIRDEQFFSSIGTTTIVYIILILFMYYIYFKLHFIKKNDSKFNVVVIGGNHHNALGVIRSLGEKEIYSNVIITNEDKYAYIVKSKYVKQYDIVAENENDIKKILLEKYSKLNPKCTLIPTSDFAALFIDKNLSELQKYFIVPNINNKPNEIEKYMNKYEQYVLAQKNGINMAQTLVIDINEKLDINGYPYPCILKPTTSALGSKSDIRICRNKQELIQSIEELKRLKYQKILLQEYVNYDYEYDVAGCCKNDNIIIPGILKKIRIYPSKCGSSSFAKVEKEQNALDIISIISKLIGSLNYQGLFDIDIFVKDKTIYLNEINFRNGANSYAFNSENVNLVFLWVQLMNYNNIAKENTKIKKEFFFFEDIGEFKQLLDKNITLKEFINSFQKAQSHSIFNCNDIMVFLFWKNFYAILRRFPKRGTK